MYAEFKFSDEYGAPEAMVDTEEDQVYIGNSNSGVWLRVEEANYLFSKVLEVIEQE